MARRFQSLEVVAIILVTIAVFVHEVSLGPIQRLVFDERYGAVPTTMWEAWRTFQEVGFRHDVWVAAMPLLTANYLHANIEHIGGTCCSSGCSRTSSRRPSAASFWSSSTSSPE